MSGCPFADARMAVMSSCIPGSSWLGIPPFQPSGSGVSSLHLLSSGTGQGAMAPLVHPLVLLPQSHYKHSVCLSQ